jgi:5-hydroxyisourate hydrolase-like protein (transthyretin family)
MKLWKLCIGFVVLLSFIALCAPIAAAAGDERYVKLISNTKYCTDCSSVYEITALDQNIKLDTQNIQFTFKDNTNSNLRAASQINKLSNVHIFISDKTQLVNRTQLLFDGTDWNVIEQEVAEDIWEPLSNSNKIIQRGDTAKIKILGTKDASAKIDNVLNLKVGNTIQTYTQWVWWDVAYLDQSYSVGVNEAFSIYTNAENNGPGTSFIPSVTAKLAYAKVYLKRIGNPANSITMSLYRGANEGGAMISDGLGNIDMGLSSSMLAADVSNAGFVEYTFNFNDNLWLQEGIPYILFISVGYGHSDANYIQTGFNNAQGYLRGQALAYYKGDNPHWHTWAADFIFQEYYGGELVVAEAENTTYETKNTLHYINITNNELNITAVSGNLTWNNTIYAGTFWKINNSIWRGNANVTPNLQLVNNTAFGHNWTVLITYVNGSIVNRTTAAKTQNVLWAYYPSKINVTVYNATEGESVTLNASVQALTTGAGLVLNFNYANSQYAGTLVTNNSGALMYSKTHATGLLGAAITNISYIANSSLDVTFGGITLNRNSTDYQNVTIWKMILTNCSTGLSTQNITLHYSLFDESYPTNPADTIWTENYEVYQTAGTARTYTWQRTTMNNISTCIFPKYAGVSFTTHQTLEYGDDIVFVKRIYESTNTVNLTQQNVSLYVLNMTEAGSTLVIITVDDITGIVQPDKIVQVWRWYLSDNTMKKSAQDMTNSGGQIGAHLRLADTYYQYTVYNAAQTIVLYNSSKMKQYGTTLTLRIGQASTPNWQIITGISKINHNLTYNNATKTFTFNWDSSGVDNTTLTISNFCLNLKYIANQTSNWTQYTTTCSVATKGTLTGITDSSIANSWGAWGYVNISSSMYILDQLGFVEDGALGHAGLFYAFIIMLLLITCGLFKPAIAIALGVGGFLILVLIGLIPISPIIVTSVVLAGIILFIYLRG